MRLVSLKLFFVLLLLTALTAAGCVRQSDQSNAVKLEDLPGTYRILRNNGEANDQSFNVEDKNGVWHLSDEEGSRLMRRMAASEIEEIFGKEVADKSQCLEIPGQTSTTVICATEPGVKTNVRIDDLMSYHKDFTSKTGYFVYIDRMGIWDLEKLK